MKKYDYIIVGQGIAGTTIAQRLFEEGRTFYVIDQPTPNQSSHVASGIWNPIVLKRMKKTWLADEMLNSLLPFYTRAEKLFDATFIKNNKVVRLFSSAAETNEWIEKCDQPSFEKLIHPKLHFNEKTGISQTHGWGEVVTSGRINTVEWLNAARQWMEKNNCITTELLDYKELKLEGENLSYKNIQAKHIIFCDGMFAAIQNPFFNSLPFALTKGELLLIESGQLHLEDILNSGIFILPLGNDLYKVGATYAWDTVDPSTTAEAREELLAKLNKIITVPYKVLGQEAGIRPTVKDRRPLLGTSKEHKNVHIFNGLGSRGVLMAPYLSQIFMDYLLRKKPLIKEANINRFFD